MIDTVWCFMTQCAGCLMDKKMNTIHKCTSLSTYFPLNPEPFPQLIMTKNISDLNFFQIVRQRWLRPRRSDEPQFQQRQCDVHRQKKRLQHKHSKESEQLQVSDRCDHPVVKKKKLLNNKLFFRVIRFFSPSDHSFRSLGAHLDLVKVKL